ncbi:MAG: ATPase, T2SS/T4P/T4SS family [Alphaproteobacteria bacterium]|jgi:general secretion pathway protein E/type IV pilus assembly protein PilB|nr:ATPase, T2SS/T4P/T4SS family [Alphaproteobacteria bacterium]
MTHTLLARRQTVHTTADETQDILPTGPLTQNEPIGQQLVTSGQITADQLRIALREQQNSATARKDRTCERLGAVLVRLGFLDQRALTYSLAERAGTETLDLPTQYLDPSLVARIPIDILRQHLVLPVRMEGTVLHLAMADPFDIVAQDKVRRYFPYATTLYPYVVDPNALRHALGTDQERRETIDWILKEIEGSKESPDKDAEHPVIRLVNFLLEEAATLGASDIHFEPEDNFVRIRYRIDGTLQQKHAFHNMHWPALSHRIKIMAGMNIADTRSIQDGRFQRHIHAGNIDFRVAIMPTVWGETIVVRLLDHSKSLRPLDTLGYHASARDKLDQILLKPQGITLVTGPTGSGKTTSLYSLLQEISSPDVHIATLENPVEYQLDLIRQTSIQDAQGLNFAAGVRGLLRMDPDIILIGEIRDTETAQMALRAAMTGHQVYSTLHCHDALGALPRMTDLGLNPKLLAGHLSGLVAQRLVRTLCPHCRFYDKPTDEEKRLLGAHLPEGHRLAKAKGCAHCNGTGRKGRTVIAEVIPVSLALSELISTEAPLSALLSCARAEGFTSMQEDGLRRVLNHEIALTDLCRAVDMTHLFHSQEGL